ncbi:TetR/AcrR family transcriptional regulator [Streptococcus gordonii]|uniref:TetR/AcrR family transcriptional regulator n=1 Tax=Streptococcus gordonii TaxID=1302 RepID=UPI00073B4C98|nr:TetR/AcrR family transcriptional regulator [Streptococcus gordonii]KTF20707.1 TetR family transcriptional regulator [Streptococcus gordonii]KXC02938.1 TetR family transcriptional regulator [Streptococcus gordonii]MBZ2150206.1 TetR/AcrR family transcriptional regulator [Streptococcus gordonii]QWZ58105.1 TetR/AcrR family transcriptional regulator [Streptococcus gordonii]SQF29470.1 TetR/AcrR family transcriptional regulator [Streptococcus gordonii]
MYEKKRRETEKLIETSLLQSMKEQTFETISIRQLIDLAEVNRSTFYRHYLDKYDLLEKIENRLLDDLQAYYQEALDSACLFKLEKDFKVEDYIHEKQNLFHFFESYLEDLAILLGPNGSPTSLRRLQEALREIFSQSIFLADPHLEEVEADLLMNHQAASFMGTLTYWLAHPHYKSQQMSDFHTKVTTVGLAGFVREHMRGD